MYRILKADKDSYVTNKAINRTGVKTTLTSSVDSNVGQAGTMDLFKLYKEAPYGGGSPSIELSRGLIHFNLDSLQALTSSFLNPDDSSFKCFLRLKNVYGGQTVPSNYTLVVNPLGKDWSEGRGSDVIGFRDLDAVNWYTASLDTVAIPVPNPPMVQYQEDVVTVTTPTNNVSITFATPFSSLPLVVITDLSSSLGTVNAFIANNTTATTLHVKFSSPFVGSFVYRAAYDPTAGTIKSVVRTPRYPGRFDNIIVGTVPVVNDNLFSVSYSDFGGTPANTYATLYETSADNLTNVYAAITSSSNVLIAGTFSSRITATVNVMGYRSLDQFYGLNNWTTGGVLATGSGGDVSGLLADYYLTGYSSLGYVPLTFSQSFLRGDEDLFVEVTPAIKLMLPGYIPNYGFRIAFTGSQETDNVTRFVKRFSTRHSQNSNLHPALVVKYKDYFFDNQVQTWFDYPNKVGMYFNPYDVPTNFMSGSTPVDGSGSLLLTLLASASQYVTATTYSYSHQAVITYQSASWAYFSASFTGSQIQVGGLNQTGSYYADVYIPSTAPGLSSVIGANKTVHFSPVWSSLDKTVTYTRADDIPMSFLEGHGSVVSQRNYAINITNLKDVYIETDVPRLRVFAFDFDPTLTSFYIPYKAVPKIFKNMHWRIIDPYTKDILVPFDETDGGTLLSSDGEGMYFDLYVGDLPLNKPMEIELLIKENNAGLFVENQRFIFKVVKA